MKSGMAVTRRGVHSVARRLSTLGIAESIALAVAAVAVVAYVTTSTVAEVQTGSGWLLDISSHHVARGGWGDIVKVTATILGIFAATIAAVLATRRQHTAETQQRHEIAKSRDERASALYVAAATQLG